MSEEAGQYCPQCGAPDQQGRFCAACGEEIREEAEAVGEPEAAREPETEPGVAPAASSTADAGEDAFEWATPGDDAGSPEGSSGPAAAEEPPAEAVSAPEEAETRDAAPTWPLWVLAALVPTWIVGVASYQAGGPLAALAGLAIVASLPLLYLDAKWASEAGELELDYPIAVPIACLLLWVLAVPAYVGYRFYER